MNKSLPIFIIIYTFILDFYFFQVLEIDNINLYNIILGRPSSVNTVIKEIRFFMQWEL